MSKHIVAIDIGASKVCASAGFIDNNGDLQVEALATAKCTGVKNSVIISIDDVVKAIVKCKNQLEDILETSIERAYMVIPNAMCEYCKNKGVIAISQESGVIKEKDIKRVLDSSKLMHVSEGKEIIEAIPMEYYVDGYRCYKNPIGMEASRLEVDALVVMAEMEPLDDFIRSVNRAGIKVEGISLQSISLAMACLSREQRNSGVAVVDIGLETVDISVYKNDKTCYNSSMIIGGHNISKDISLCLKVPYNNAEDLKIQYGIVSDEEKRKESIKVKTSYDDIVEVGLGTLSQIIEARVEQILQIIKTELEKNELYDKISNIVLVGGGITQFKHIIDIAEDIFKMPIEIGMPRHVGALSPVYANVVGVLEDVANSLKEELEVNELNNTEHEESDFEDDSDEDLDEEKNKSGIMNKIKGFLEEFF